MWLLFQLFSLSKCPSWSLASYAYTGLPRQVPIITFLYNMFLRVGILKGSRFNKYQTHWALSLTCKFYSHLLLFIHYWNILSLMLSVIKCIWKKSWVRSLVRLLKKGETQLYLLAGLLKQTWQHRKCACSLTAQKVGIPFLYGIQRLVFKAKYRCRFKHWFIFFPLRFYTYWIMCVKNKLC